MSLPPSIEHIREIIRNDDGGIEQIYNHLIYRFEGSGTVARAYLDEPSRVAILQPGSVAEDVIEYLKARFWQIDQLGRDGYSTIWKA